MRLAPARLVLIAAAIGTMAAVAGCGSSSSPASIATTTSYPPLRPPAATPPRSTHRVAGPRVGQTVRVHASGTVLSVTIKSLIDPLRGSGASLSRGTEAVGVEAVIADDGPGGYDSSSTGDFSVVTSAGTAPPVFASRGVCQTPLRDWDNEISAGETRSGCNAYALPPRGRVLAIRFAPHAELRRRVTWTVAP
jgi:hypothetical protein